MNRSPDLLPYYFEPVYGGEAEERIFGFVKDMRDQRIPLDSASYRLLITYQIFCLHFVVIGSYLSLRSSGFNAENILKELKQMREEKLQLSQVIFFEVDYNLSSILPGCF